MKTQCSKENIIKRISQSFHWFTKAHFHTNCTLACKYNSYCCFQRLRTKLKPDDFGGC